MRKNLECIYVVYIQCGAGEGPPPDPDVKTEEVAELLTIMYHLLKGLHEYLTR